MSSVVMPQQKQKSDGLGSALQIAAVVPGPHQPFAAGASVLKGMSQKEQTATPTIEASASQGAMQRRMQSMEASQQNAKALAEADSALMQLPPAQAAQYAPTIKRARQLAESEIA